MASDRDAEGADWGELWGGAPGLKNALLAYFWVTEHFWQIEKCDFFAQFNAQNLYENDVVKNVGGKTGECLRENWESWALRRCSAKTGEDHGTRVSRMGWRCPLPPGYGADAMQ